MFTLMFGVPVSMSRQPEWAREMEHRIITRLERFTIMATQAEIDAVTSGLADLKSKLDADDSAIQQEIASLQAANPSLDLSGLQSAVSDLSASVDATTALVPAPDAPAPGA